MKSLANIVLMVCLLSKGAAYAVEVEWSGYIDSEVRWFPHTSATNALYDTSASLSIQPELYVEWQDGYQSISIVPFMRWDQHDPQRSHFDMREFTWLMVFDESEFRFGLRKVFWGVTEAQHLVDIINQTDLVENPDGEDKLGQPMLNYAMIRDWGTVDFFLMPYFRERRFPGSEGRLRSDPWVDGDQTRYESDQGEKAVDYALRWSHFIGELDIGLSHFVGTSRDPSLVAGVNGNGEAVLIPFYERINQTGVDIQATFDAWLWKLEGIYRSGQGESYFASTAGFEYTLFGISETNWDLGLIFEYLFDDRRERASSPFQNDSMLGFRLALNDEVDSQLLAGMIHDHDGRGQVFTLEASRRIGDQWLISTEARIYSPNKQGTPLASFRNDDYLQLDLKFYF